jgi:hypothetical protein
MTPLPFGSCCRDLQDALEAPEKKLLKVGAEGILYLTVGTLRTDMGTGWMEQAIMFCPFCGTRLQTEEEILMKAVQSEPTVH